MKNVKNTIFICISFVYALSNFGCMQEDTHSSQYYLSVAIRSDSLELEVVNNSQEILRIWELQNSWGWPTISLELKKVDADKTVLLYPRTDQRWTINYPSHIEIPPGESQKLSLNTYDNLWEQEEGVTELIDSDMLMRVLLKITSSKEAKENEIFIGTMKSEWVKSSTPHLWLSNKIIIN